MIDKHPTLKIGQIFLESASFAHRPDALAIPPGQVTADVGDVDVEMTLGVAKDDESKGLLRICVSTKPANNPIYEFKVAMVALAHSDRQAGAPPVRDYLASSGIILLYPFLRETIANLTLRGRFGPVWLNPIDPNALRRAANDQLGENAEAPFSGKDESGEKRPSARRTKSRKRAGGRKKTTRSTR